MSSRFLTEGLPFPVVIAETTFEELRDLRLGDYTGRLRALGVEIDTEKVLNSPHVAAPESAAAGDLYFTKLLNHTARVSLLSQFAEGEDLDLHAQEEGLERFPGEGDPALRERIRLTRKGKSAAGPDDYYISRARNTDAHVIDVAVDAETVNSSERVLILSVLTDDNGGVVSEELKARLTATLNDPTFRSRNVTVRVVPAVISVKAVTAIIYLYPNAIIPDDDEAVLRAVYAKDQSLGFDMTDSYIKKILHRPGVQRVELPGWTNAFADANEAIAIGEVSIQRVRLTS